MHCGWWWLRTLPIAVGAGLAGVLVVELVLWVWRPFPDELPLRILAWIAVAWKMDDFVPAASAATRN